MTETPRAADATGRAGGVQSKRGRGTLIPAAILLSAALAVLAGQDSLNLITMDDLRETEVAREMWATGDYLVPHLAGLPFVEKPPGFQAIVAASYRLAGGPSVRAARLTAAAFALLSLAAVFLLGRAVGGALTGAIAAILLATAMLFCRTAHTVLLDNALTAAMAWSLFFFWRGLDADAPRCKRGWYAAAAFTVGVSFLFKGFVGPAIAASATVSVWTLGRRWGDARAALHPACAAVFLGPVLLWLVPFILASPPRLVREFLVLNHFGRAAYAYESHAKPIYYYLFNVWIKFFPASLLLPLAICEAWRLRAQPDDGGAPPSSGRAVLPAARHPQSPLPAPRAGWILLAAFLGPAFLLSLSLAKDAVYLLPAYPALAGLVAWAWSRRIAGSERLTKIAVALSGGGTLAILFASAGLAVALRLALAVPLCAASAMAAAAVAWRWARRTRDPAVTAWTVSTFLAVGAVLCCTDPILSWYVAPRDPTAAFRTILAAAGDRDLLLYQPDDPLRGGCGFYRNRTAPEIWDPRALVERLSAGQAVALVRGDLERRCPELLAEARRAGVELEAEYPFHRGLRRVALIRARAAGD